MGKWDESSEITQFRVTTANNFPALTRCMNGIYAVHEEQARSLFLVYQRATSLFLVYRVYSVNGENIFMWICEVQYAI
jgi:hypothetical protein